MYLQINISILYWHRNGGDGINNCTPPMTTSTKFGVNPREMEGGWFHTHWPIPLLIPHYLSSSIKNVRCYIYIYIYKKRIEYSVDFVSFSNLRRFSIFEITFFERWNFKIDDMLTGCRSNQFNMFQVMFTTSDNRDE